MIDVIQYRGLKGRLERVIVDEGQVDRQIEQLIEQNPRLIPVIDRPSRLDDELVLDYSGTVDGVPFEGGQAEGQTLVLGSGMFIPGFEDQLVGHRPGDEVDVFVTFPQRYHAPHLAGKAAVFHCRIHEIRLREKYAPGDDFAREVFKIESYEALRAQLREALQAYADRQAEEDLSLKLLDQVAGQCDGEIDEETLNRAVDGQLRSLEAQLNRQGLTLEAYCQFSGKTREVLRSEHIPDARRAIMRQRAIDEIARAEGIEADEASVEEALREICRQNGLTIEELSEHMNEAAQAAVVRNVIAQKVLKLLREVNAR